MNGDNQARTSKERDTDKIVDAALELYAERGPSRVSLRQVAQHAGVNYGLIHQYVGSKDQLLELVFTRLSETWADAFSAADGTESAVAVLLRPKSDAYVRLLAHLILEGRDPGEFFKAPPALRELVRRLEDGGDEDARLQAAVLTCMSMGWGLFGPHVKDLADLSDSEGDVDAEAYAYLRRVFADRRASNATN
ncbi:TetR/AcrR family transcriptional regulator [Gordonia neofelifaecis]|uniref:Transcriptional regulator n=1 Tax=Gordonia neofelifaecis NRRL B-59395 TaxID=644548 RepID=F1YGX5_9ACTN|nr:TetR/AcrR family transcriptional regulator [Gordonia neofelifaecis]EGD56273.1 transcriptional regulator [Gordonia neofelifaecis NRRL B-59395]